MPFNNNAERKRYYDKSRIDNPNKGRRWTRHERERLKDLSITDTQLSIELGRSVMAIQTKRSKLRSSGELTMPAKNDHRRSSQ